MTGVHLSGVNVKIYTSNRVDNLMKKKKSYHFKTPSEKWLLTKKKEISEDVLKNFENIIIRIHYYITYQLHIDLYFNVTHFTGVIFIFSIITMKSYIMNNDCFFFKFFLTRSTWVICVILIYFHLISTSGVHFSKSNHFVYHYCLYLYI